MRRRSAAGTEHRLLLLLSALLVPLSLLWFWPLPLAPSHMLLVEPDPFLASFHEVWLAWVLRASESSDLLRLQTDLVAAPEGLDLRYYQEWLPASLAALISLPLELLGLSRSRALVLGLNLAHGLAWIFTGLAVMRLARTLGSSVSGLVVAGVALLASPVLRSMVALVNPEQLWVGLVALAAHCVLSGEERPLRAGLLAALCGALAGMATRYLFFGTAGMLLVMALGGALMRRPRLAAAAGLGLFFLVPVGLFLGWPQLAAGDSAPTLLQSRPVIPGPADMLLPHILYSPDLDPMVESHAYSAYVGWALLILSALAAWRGGTRVRLVVAAGVALLVAGMGWALPGGQSLPLSWVGTVVPVIERLHAPHRFILAGQALLAGAAATAVGPRVVPVAVLALLGEGLFAARGLLPFPVAALPAVGPGLAQVAAHPGPTIDLRMDDDLRSAYHHDLQSQARQIHHGAPLMQMPSWPAGGAPRTSGVPPGIELWLADELMVRSPSESAVFSLAEDHPAARAAEVGLEWIIITLPPDQRELHLCGLRGKDDDLRLICGPATLSAPARREP